MLRTLLLFITLLVASTAWATPSKPLSIEEHNNLVYWRVCLDSAANFQKRGIVSSTEQYQQAVQVCLDGAKSALGRDITFNEIVQGVKTTSELTTSQKVVGWVTGFSMLQALSAAGIGIFGSIFLFYAFPVFVAIPKTAYELLLYGGAFGLTGYGLTLPDGGYFYGFIGVLLFAGSLAFSAHIHRWKNERPWGFFAIIMAYAAVAAFLFQSTLIGFVAVTALLASAGFMAYAFGLGYVIGFQDEKSVPIGTFVAFLVLGLYLAMRMMNVDQPYIQVFAPGAYWMGSFVGFLGLLIMTSKWYARGSSFFVTNFVLMPIAGLGAIIIGSVYGVPELSRIGGTFLVLFVVEKYVEVTMHGMLSASFFGLVGSGVLFMLANWALQNSDKVGPYLLFVS